MFTALPAATTQARLHDQVKAEAERLRRAAIQNFGRAAMDAFWRGADAVWQRSLQTGQAMAERSAARLKARLTRRADGRRASTPCAPTPNPTMHSGV